MKKQGVFLLIIVFVIGAFCSDASAGKRVDMTEAMINKAIENNKKIIFDQV